MMVIILISIFLQLNMSDKKLFFPKINPSDVQMLHQDGGGILMNNDGRFIFGSLSEERLEQLYAENFNGNVETNFNFTSIIGIMNQTSSPRLEIQEGNENRTTIINPTDNNLIPAPEQSICNEPFSDNNEFKDIAKTILNWETFNSNVGSNNAFYSDNKFERNEETYRLYFGDLGGGNVRDIILKNYPPDPINPQKFKNLGWGENGGLGTSNYTAGYTVIDDFYSNYWNFTLIPPSENTDEFKKRFKHSKLSSLLGDEFVSIFKINRLPPGLRSMAARANFNSGETWVSRILTTVGPDYLNIPGLGITIVESRSDGLSMDVKKAKFRDQYEKIIEVYNKDKATFLTTLAKENKDWYNRFVDQGSLDRFKEQPDAFKKFYNTYVDIALAVAIQYSNCPPEYILTNGPSVSPPTPQPSITLPSVIAPNIEPTKAPVFNVQIGDDNGIYEIDLNGMPDKEGDSVNRIDDNEEWVEDDYELIYGVSPKNRIIPDPVITSIPHSALDQPVNSLQSPVTKTQDEVNKEAEKVAETKQKNPQFEKKPDKQEDSKLYRTGNIEKNHNFQAIPGNQNNYRSAQMPVRFNSSTGQYEGDFVDAIRKYNIKTVIRMNGDKGDNKRGKYPAITTAVEKAMCASLGVEYVWINAHPPKAVNPKINKYLQKGNTLIHCLHGADRTGGHVGGYLLSSGIMTDPEQLWTYTTGFNNWKGYIKKGGFYYQSKGMGSGYSQYALTFLTEKQLEKYAPIKK